LLTNASASILRRAKIDTEANVGCGVLTSPSDGMCINGHPASNSMMQRASRRRSQRFTFAKVPKAQISIGPPILFPDHLDETMRQRVDPAASGLMTQGMAACGAWGISTR
jgi:hypothetical protein